MFLIEINMFISFKQTEIVHFLPTFVQQSTVKLERLKLQPSTKISFNNHNAGQFRKSI